jgi:hypothetical protein
VIEEEIQPVAAPKPVVTTGWPLSPQFLAFAAGAALLFALGWIAGHVSRSPGATVFASDMPGSMRWIWRQWLSDPSGATICLTTPQTIVVKRYPELHAESKIEEPIPERSPRARTLREFFHLPPGGALVEYPSVGQAKMGEAIAAIRLASLFAAHGAPIQVEHASFLEWNQARNENLIVFGHRKHPLDRPPHRRLPTPDRSQLRFVAQADYGGPAYFDMDSNLTRIFKITEKQRMELRFEFFNLLNHTNFSNPINNLHSSTSGLLQSSADPRLLQFAVKYSF